MLYVVGLFHCGAGGEFMGFILYSDFSGFTSSYRGMNTTGIMPEIKLE